MTDLLQLVLAAGLLGSIAVIVVLTLTEAWRNMKAKKSGLRVEDERTRRIQGRAALYALIVGQDFTVGLILVLLVGSQFPWFPGFSALLALQASLLVSVASFLVLRWHLNQREDVQ